MVPDQQFVVAVLAETGPAVGSRRGKAGAGAGRAQTPASPEARQRRCQSCRKESRPGRAAEAQMAGRAPDRQVAWRLALGAWRLALGAWRLALNSRAHVDNADTSSPADAPGPLMRTPARIGRRMITTACSAVSTAGFPGFPNERRAQRPRPAVGPTHTKFAALKRVNRGQCREYLHVGSLLDRYFAPEGGPASPPARRMAAASVPGAAPNMEHARPDFQNRAGPPHPTGAPFGSPRDSAERRTHREGAAARKGDRGRG